MSEHNLAPYAVACTRERSGCQRCGSLECTYSRHGTIRRTRKRRPGGLAGGTVAEPPPTASGNDSHKPSASSTPAGAVLDSHLTADIETTRETLGVDGPGRDTRSLGALTALAEACAAIWQDQPDSERSSKSFFAFDEQTPGWVDIFTSTLERGRPLLSMAPPDVISHLRNLRPDLVRTRAWLVMYYGMVLSNITSNDPTNEAIKGKLRCNLWLSLNDGQLFMEPSEANIQALTILACHVEEFTTPSLCWMLTSTACRMLQALGVNHRRLDPQTRERRSLIFFHLNILDKGLSITFGRPPTFHRAMSREIPPPTLEQLRPMQPHVTTAGTSSLFGVHFFHQLAFLTRILGDVWYCLYEDAEPNDNSIRTEIDSLESWHVQARTILDAAAMTERPFMTPESSASIELGLRMIEFQYNYVLILLCRALSSFRSRAVSSSKDMLMLLPHMVSDSEQPFNGIVWQLVCSPFTAFLTLFTNLLSCNAQKSEERAVTVAAMEQLPVYLGKMALRSPLAKKLERVAAALLDHAKSIAVAQDINGLEPAMPVDWSTWDATFNDILAIPDPNFQDPDGFTLDTTSFPDWTLDICGDPSLDWMGWDALN